MKKEELEKLLRGVFDEYKMSEDNFLLRLELWWMRFEDYEIEDLKEAFKYLPEVADRYRPPMVHEAVDCLNIYKYYGGVN